MTEEEKKRLNELIADSEKDDFRDFTFERDDKSGDQYQVVDYNPFEIASNAGEGFMPSLNEQERLKLIDSKLERRNYSRLLTGSTRTNGVSPSISSGTS